VAGPLILVFGDTTQAEGGTAFTSEAVLALSAEPVFADFTIESVLTFTQAKIPFANVTGEAVSTLEAKAPFANVTDVHVLHAITASSLLAYFAKREHLAVIAEPVFADITIESVSALNAKAPFAAVTDEDVLHTLAAPSLMAYFAKSEQPAVIAVRFSASITAYISFKAVNAVFSFTALFASASNKTIVAGMEATFFTISKLVPLIKVSTLATTFTTNSRHGTIGTAWIGRSQPMTIILLTTEKVFLLAFRHLFQFATMQVAKVLAQLKVIRQLLDFQELDNRRFIEK
jgi:hypothetical protein